MPTERTQEMMPPYSCRPTIAPTLSIVRGRGTKVYDLEGREYLDFVGGIAVNVSGMATRTWFRPSTARPPN